LVPGTAFLTVTARDDQLAIPHQKFVPGTNRRTNI